MTLSNNKTIATLVDDINALYTHPKGVDAGLFERFGKEIGETIANRLGPREERPGALRMSNIGRPDRQLWYDINPLAGSEREAFSASTLVKFSFGDILEALLLVLAEQAGHSVTRKQEEVRVDGIVGHIDACIDGVVVDCKSASSYSFDKFKSGALLEPGNDPFGYLGQLAGYTEAIDRDADGAFLVIDKTLGKICLLTIPNEVLKQYRVRDRIEHIKIVTSASEPPPRCYESKPDGKSGNYVLPTGCSYCAHKAYCWEDANNGRGLRTFLYSSGPRFYTHVEREPSVTEVGGVGF